MCCVFVYVLVRQPPLFNDSRHFRSVKLYSRYMV